MQIKRQYAAEEAPAELMIQLDEGKTATTVLLYSRSEETEDGVVVTEVADPSPKPAEYGKIVEAVIALRYTPGAEIALNRLPDDDPEKIDYLAFVERAKAAARAVLGLE